MAKKKFSVDRILEKAAEEVAASAVEEAVEEKFRELGTEDEMPGREFPDEDNFFVPESKETKFIDNLISSIPNKEGYYIKLYKELSPGQFELKMRIDDYEHWTDLENEVMNIVKSNTISNPMKWGSGKYKIMVFKEGKSGFQRKPCVFNIDASEKSFIEHDGVRNKLQEVGEFMKQVKEVLPSNPSGNEDVGKNLTEMLKAGIEIARAATPNVSSQEQSLEKTILLLKNLGLIKAPEKEQDMITIVTTLKDLYKPKEEDFWAKLIQMKELGIIKFGSETVEKDDTFSSIEKITGLIELMKPLMGIAGETSKPSIAVKLIEVLGPQVPKIVENITTAVGKIADVSKMKLSSHMGVTASPQLRPSPIPVEAPHSIKQPIQDNISAGEKSMNPIVKDIYAAVQSDNHEFFPKLKELMATYVGPHIFEVLISKQITIDSFLQSLNSMLQTDFLLEENTKKYFETFLSWMVGNTITAKCDACGEIFDFETEEMFKQDSKICDCGGALMKIETQLVGTA